MCVCVCVRACVSVFVVGCVRGFEQLPIDLALVLKRGEYGLESSIVGHCAWNMGIGQVLH